MTSHNPYDINPFSSPVFSSFLPHHFYFFYFTSLCGMVEECGEEALVGGRGVGGEKEKRRCGE